MGYSVSVTTATDDEIRAFQSQPKELELFLGGSIDYHPRDNCYLANLSGRISGLRTKEMSARNPLSHALGQGDVKYDDVPDRTHAIFSETTKALAMTLAEISESVFCEYRDSPGMKARADNLCCYWVPDARKYEEIRKYTAEELDEIIIYFCRLRDLAADAAEKNMGLIFCEFEDW